MSKLDSAQMPILGRATATGEAPITISQDDARQGPMGHQVTLCSWLRARRCDPRERARIELFRLDVRVGLKTDLTTLRGRCGCALSNPLAELSWSKPGHNRV